MSSCRLSRPASRVKECQCIRTPLLVHCRLPLLLVGNRTILTSLDDIVPPLLPPPPFGLCFFVVAALFDDLLLLLLWLHVALGFGSAGSGRGRRFPQCQRLLPRESNKLQRRIRNVVPITSPRQRPSIQERWELGREGGARRRRGRETFLGRAPRYQNKQKHSGAGVRRQPINGSSLHSSGSISGV
jgi:hypothetical protein